MKYCALIVAAGSGTRFKANGNKLLYTLSDGQRVIDKTLSVFKNDEDCQQIVVVSSSEIVNYLANQLNDYHMCYCYGGKSRSESVYHGLMAVNCDYVFVHDGARCYLTDDDLKALKEGLKKDEACILAHRVTDTIKTVDKNGYIVSTIDRNRLRGAQTPQAFRTDLLIDCYKKAFQQEITVTDDASVVELFSDVKVKCIESISANSKITTINDIR